MLRAARREPRLRFLPKASPLRRLSIARLLVVGVIGVTLILALTLQGGFFRAFFRFAIFLGAAIIVASYVVEWWWKRRDGGTR